MREQEVVIHEATSEDAKALAALLEQVRSETTFLTADSNVEMTPSDLAIVLDRQLEVENGICLLAKIDTAVVGVLNVSASTHDWDRHIGDVFIAVAKPYWGYGLGSFLMEALIDWAEQTPLIVRLELTVQTQNVRAISLYQKFGFAIEGTKKCAVRMPDGQFLDVYIMSRLMNGE